MLVRGMETDLARARLLSVFIASGLFFMLVPGTLLGVLNLVQISGRESLSTVSPAWMQAHGHAQIFGWIGSFILGIGLYSVPHTKEARRATLVRGWLCWSLWTIGVSARWIANVYAWHWRVILPASAALELIAFLVFASTVAGHRPRSSGDGPARFETWTIVVMAGTAGFLFTLMMNMMLALYIGLHETTPAVPHLSDQEFLILAAWGFLAPFVFGFSARWMPTLLGLQATRARLLLAAVGAIWIGIFLALAKHIGPATVFLVVAAVLAIAGLRLFEKTIHDARTRGVHRSFPVFVRLAYIWLLVGAALGVAASRWDVSGGLWGASRHAFTVGFVSMMVFAVGQRVLPAFAGARILWSLSLMFAGLLLLAVGCTLRVASEVIAYQGYGGWAWSVLPLSAVIEMGAVTMFAANMVMTFVAGDKRRTV
jgi:uncharacterized protein involved in response to NO